jgi:multidrug transporter EmrE-like cation transporter
MELVFGGQTLTLQKGIGMVLTVGGIVVLTTAKN